MQMAKIQWSQILPSLLYEMKKEFFSVSLVFKLEPVSLNIYLIQEQEKGWTAHTHSLETWLLGWISSQGILEVMISVHLK